MDRLLRQNVLLEDYSNYKIGGPARYFLEFKNTAELERGLREWLEIAKNEELDKNKFFVIGGATNILFNDNGYDGLILHNSINFLTKIGNDLEVGAGTTIDELSYYCVEHSLSGIEWAGGLPGTLGGAVFGNAGAFGGETKDKINLVKSYKVANGKIVERVKEKCQFGYRDSIFKKNNEQEIILSATLNLEPGDRSEIQRKTKEKIKYRQDRQPLEYPNIGSMFKNIDIKKAPPELIEQCKTEIKTDPFPVIPAAYLIYLVGLSGTKAGDAQISIKHPNFIINLGHAEGKNVKRLVRLVQGTVLKKFGVLLETEIVDLTSN